MENLKDELIATHTASMLSNYRQACKMFAKYKSYTRLESTDYLICTRLEVLLDNEQNSLDSIIDQLQALKAQLADKKVSFFTLESKTNDYDETTYYACYTIIELQSLDSAMDDITGKAKCYATHNLWDLEHRKGTKRHDDIMSYLEEFRAKRVKA